MSSCVDLLKGINPSCDALKKAGGVNKRIWICQKNQITAYTKDADGNLDSITLDTTNSITSKLKKFIGQTYKNSATYELQVGENVNTFNHSLAMVIYHSTHAERDTIEQLVNAEDLVAFIETNAGQIEVLGFELGIKASAGTGGTGVNLNDATSYTLTLSGQQRKLPQLMLVTDLAGTITYLDNLSA